MTAPHEMLAEVGLLRRHTRELAHAGAWLPAAAVAALLLASVALYRYPFGTSPSIVASYPFWSGLPDEERSTVGSYLFWFLGTPLVFTLIALWYRARARRVGVRVAWQPFVAVGLGVLVVLAVLAAIPDGRSNVESAMVGEASATMFWRGLLTPLLPVSLAVVALGIGERSRVLIASGVWIGLLAVWLCGSTAIGRFSGGQLTLRPGHYLVAMALPLIGFAVARGVRTARSATHA